MISFLPCPRLASRVRIGVLLRFTWVGNRIDGRVDDNGRWCVDSRMLTMRQRPLVLE